MSVKRLARAGFAAFALLAVLGLFVLDGAAAGATLFAGLILFIVSCILSLSGRDADARGSERAGVAGWLGGWF